MGNDLISRSDVLKMLKSCLLGGDREYEYVKTHIDSIPTAYDVDNVIEQVQKVHLPSASQKVRIIGYIKAGGID